MVIWLTLPPQLSTWFMNDPDRRLEDSEKQNGSTTYEPRQEATKKASNGVEVVVNSNSFIDFFGRA